MSGPDRAAVAAEVARLQELHGVPGVAVGTLDPDGETVAAFGVTNVDHPLPVDADTVFEIASITKTMTATVAARLAAEGRLALDAPVRSILPDFRVADAALAARVTVRDLFTHTAGWAGESLPVSPVGPDAIATAVAALGTLETVSPPGVYSYNNVSLTVAGRVIEVCSGRPYAEAMRELLFAPLGMERTAFRAEALLYERLAAGHTVRDGRPVRVRERLSGGWAGDPAGGVRSTVRDLLRYARFHLGDGTAPGGARLLPAEALAAMRAPRVPRGPDGHVGLAWALQDRGGVQLVEHGGATVAHMSELVLVPARGAAYVILTNGATGTRLYAALGEWLCRSWLGLPPAGPPRPLDPAPDVRPYAGRYWAPLSDIALRPAGEGLELQLTWKGAVAERPLPPPVRLAFTAPDAVVALGSDPPVQGDFLRDAAGAIAYFRWGGRARRRIG